MADLLAATGGGGLVERPRIALTDALSGTLLALTDLPGAAPRRHLRRPRVLAAGHRRCTHDLTGRPGLGPPGADRRLPALGAAGPLGPRPGPPLSFPGLPPPGAPRMASSTTTRPYPLGPTSATNLTGYCTGHHRGKHQAPGWLHALAPDGTLTVTTPTGLTAVTTPPPY